MKTKSLPKTLLALCALMTCLFMRPNLATAQTSVPYHTWVGGEYLPTGWTANYGGVWYNGLEFYAFNTGTIILPEFNVPTNTLTVDVRVEPFYDPPYASSFDIGYLTDVNDLGSFHIVESFSYSEESWTDGWRWKRAILSNVPANARIAFYAYYPWFISDVSVYETPGPVDVPYSVIFYSNSQNEQPEGWYANNYGVNNGEHYFRTGTAVLPQFTSNLNTLQLDLSFKPRNTTAQSIEIGYINSNNNFTSLSTYTYSSTWTEFEPKRIAYFGSPSGSRMAIRCNGQWSFQGVRVTNKTSSPYDIPYQPSFDMFQPEGWEAGNYMYSEGAYFFSGIAYLPQFSSNLNTLQLNLDLKPKEATAQSIEFGYINSSNSFVPLRVLNYSSSWTSYETKTILYSNASSNGRMAFRCNGKWCVDNLMVKSMPSPTNLPYTATLYSQTPAGWIAENYHRYSNTNVPYSWLSTGCAILPQFNYSINSLQLDICIAPYDQNSQSISLGYITNPNDPSTFTAIRTYNYETSWYTNFQPKRIYFNNSGSIPTGARMAIYCNGDWKIDHVHVQVQTGNQAFSVPYTPTLGSSSLPEGWITDSYYYYEYSGRACLASGCTILPQFNASLNTLQLDICLAPRDNSSQSISIGYVTNNNPSTFTAIKTYNKESSWTYNVFRPKRVSFNVSGLPSGARLAIYCSGIWRISDLNVYVPSSSYDVPYTATFAANCLPEGWIAENYLYSEGAYLATGCAILPVFNAAISTLQMDLGIMPKNLNAQSISIGYVTNSNPSTFTALQTFYASSSWTGFLPKCIPYNGVPNGARMAIYCNGDWSLGGVQVRTIQSNMTTFNVPYNSSFTDNILPEGWITSNYYYSGTAYFTSGCAILPMFNAATNTLQMNVRAKPKNDDAQYIKVGYVTNNNPSTFVALQTFYNTSLWGIMQHKRILYNYSWMPTDARMAILFNGEWFVDDVDVEYIPQPISAPYTCNCYYDCVGNETFGFYQAPGWIANNYRYYGSNPLFGTGCAMLPEFNVPISSLQLIMDIAPYIGFEGIAPTSISIGYVTNNNPSTFVACQTYNYTSGWGAPTSKTVNFGHAPANARIAFVCDGEWQCDNVHVTPQPIVTVPYTQNFESATMPEGWKEYNGSLVDSNTSYTATLTPASGRWHFGTANGTYGNSSHAYCTIGDGTHYSWLVSTPISLDANTNLLSFDIALTKVSGNLQQVTPDAQNHTRVFVLISSDFGDTWTELQSWKHEMGYTDLESLTPAGTHRSYSLSSYANQIVLVGFYVECTDSGDADNRIHIDNFVVEPFDPSLQPSSVTVSNVVYTTAKVSWTRQSPTQTQWDVCVCEASETTPPAALIHHVQGYLYYNVNGLEGGHTYKAWVRFHNGSAAGEWVASEPFSTGVLMTPPYTQEFANSLIPEGWRSFYGSIEGSSSPYTATLTPESGRWQFGAANGVFGGSSHAWASIGNHIHSFWLVSTPVALGSNANMLSFDMALTQASGNMVPVIPDAQDNTIIKVLISADYGATWIPLQSWKHEMGYTDLESIQPEGAQHAYTLSAYAGQEVLIGFYMECTDPDDAANRIHIDNFSIGAYDPTLPPTAVTMSEVAGHSAKVSWTPASSVQYKWDVIVAHPAYTPTATIDMTVLQDYGGVMEHVQGYRYKTMTGLVGGETYKAWVRYNDGTYTSSWSGSTTFYTESMCAIPTNIQVEVTQTTAFVTWEPGQGNQTSWYTYGGTDDQDGETVYEPFRLLTGLIPGEEYEIQITGNCEDNDGDSETVSVVFTTLPLPSLTVNNGTATSYTAVINAYETDANYASTQFVIPANEITDMQYSTIQQLQFYCSNVVNGTPWGNAQFRVYMKEVDFSTYSEFCDDYFYPWSDMTSVYDGSLSISNGIMTITPWESNRFYYRGGDLLVGIYQYVAGSYGQAQWYGTVKSDPMSGYIMSQYDEDIVNCSTFAPKVTFTYEPDSFMPPTNLVVHVTAPDQVTLTWTPREGQTATDVQLFDEDMEPIGTPWTWGGGNVFGLANLDPGTTYNVCIRGLYRVDGVNYYSAWTVPVEFTTLDLCDAPENLQANDVGPFTATLTWDSSAAYEEVEYRALATQWEEGFEGLSGNGLPSGWTKFFNGNGQTTGGWWNSGSLNGILPHSGDRQMRSTGFPNFQTDDWLILPQMELGGVLKLWACTTQGTQQSFSVYVSTTGTNIADFGTTPVMTSSTLSYQEFTIDLSGYEGLGYVAIRHQHDVSSVISTLAIDDVSYLNGGDWTSLGYVEGGQYDLEGLTPGATYRARVRSVCEVGDATYPGYWTDPVSFSTPSNIVFQDGDVKEVCVTNWDTNSDGELSYAEAAAVTSLGQVFRNNTDIVWFNELQYFTGLMEIGDHAFEGCADLSTITLPNTITSIGNYSFGYCANLHGIVIPNGVTSIVEFAFNASGLTEVILPTSVTTIGYFAFGECNSLEYVYLPASVTSIDGNAFTGASIETIEVDQENPVYDSRGGCNAIIQTDINKLITGCKSTVIPDDVVSIGVSAFENATNLTTINLPSSVESIGEYAFLNCDGLTTIYAERPLPPTIYSNTFLNMVHSNVTVNVPCGALADYRNAEIWSGLNFNYVDPCNIVFADANAKAICVSNWDTNGDGELSYAEAAVVTTLNPSGESNSSVFKSNTTITSFDELQYFTGLTSIEADAFSGCTHMTSIILPNTITSVGESAFANCYSLTAFTIPTSVTTLNTNSFANCLGLTSIHIPASVTSIGQNPFSGCSGLGIITVDEGNTRFTDGGGNVIVQNSNHHLISGCKNSVIPEGVVHINAMAFNMCAGLTSIVIPNSVTYIGISAFQECTGLTSVTIGRGVTTISARAFRYCSILASISVLATTPPTFSGSGTNAPFYNVSTDIPVYVPCESIEAYQAATGWSSFTNYQESDEYICFADPAVKAICVDPATGWDTNGDGQLSYAEAAAVTSLGQTFRYKPEMETFDELQYFTGLTAIDDQAFCENQNLVSIILPEGITSIGFRAFDHSEALPSIIIPNSVTTIGVQAFWHCVGLAEVTLGTGLTNIEETAFLTCTGLTTIYALSAMPPFLVSNDVFAEVPKENVVVYVPCEAVQYYRNNNGWGGFTNFVGEGCEQMVSLSSGWNWWTPTVAMSLADLETGLGGAGVIINTQDGGFARYENGVWSGTLTSIAPGQMYKIKLTADVSFEVSGDRPVVEIPILQGYNWFGFKGYNNMPIPAFLSASGFGPVNGDKIISRTGTAELVEGYWQQVEGTWPIILENFPALVPGEGYIYYSNDTETKILRY